MFSDLRLSSGAARHELLELLSELRAVRDFQRGDAQVRRALQRVHGAALLKTPLAFAAGRYTRTLVFRDERVEVLLLAWDEAAKSPIHDHAGQQCWFMPLAGKFLLHDYALIQGGQKPGPARVERAGVRESFPGEVDHRDVDQELHRVEVAPGCVAAVSLHVYAQPIDACLVFDEKRSRCGRRKLRYDAVANLR